MRKDLSLLEHIGIARDCDNSPWLYIYVTFEYGGDHNQTEIKGIS